MSNANANAFCAKLNSGLIVPGNEMENMEIYNLASIYSSQCFTPAQSTTFLWLGITDEANESIWTDMKVRNMIFF